MSETTPLLLQANGLIPACEDPATKMLPLECQIPANTTTCIIGAAALATRYIRTLGGVDSAAQGELHLLGIEVSGLERKEWLALRKRVGYVGRGAPLLSVMGALRNVMLPALYHKLGSAESVEAHARSLISALQCDADLYSLPAYLTPLQRRQLAIARALVLDPKLLFLDAPFEGLELSCCEPLRTYLGKWPWFAGRALVVATEDLRFVREHADNIVFVSRNSVDVFDGWQAFAQADAGDVAQFIAERKRLLAVFD